MRANFAIRAPPNMSWAGRNIDFDDFGGRGATRGDEHLENHQRDSELD
jgi:hypothetical protein